MSDFLMPKLGADMTAGTLVSWRKKPGDPVRRGDIMAEVDTDKGIIDIEAFGDGILDSLLVQPGASVPVGTPLARIRGAGEAKLSSEVPAPPSSPDAAVKITPLPVTRTAPSSAPAAEDLSRLRISPSARRRARELGVDPSTVAGSGRGGAITREDIEQAADAHAAPPPPPESLSAAAAGTRGIPETPARSKRMRQAIAVAMARSNREIPHYYLATTIDLKPALDWLAKMNEQRSVTERLLYGVLLLKATALALREVPELNAYWQDDQLVTQSAIHLGVAISLRGGGLIAPALHDVDNKPLPQLMNELRDLVARVRTGGLRSSELSDATITVTSLGEQGVEAVYGVIYPPQVALVGFGKIVERPWCMNNQVISRPVVTATLAGDHRATDGHRGGVFLAALEHLLQEPDKL